MSLFFVILKLVITVSGVTTARKRKTQLGLFVRLLGNNSSELLSANVLTNYTHPSSSLLTCLYVIRSLCFTVYRHDADILLGRRHVYFTLACQGLVTLGTSKRKRMIFLRHLPLVTCRTGELRIKCLPRVQNGVEPIK